MFPLEPEMGICHISLPPKHCDGEVESGNQSGVAAGFQAERPGGGGRGLVEGAAACALRPVH